MTSLQLNSNEKKAISKIILELIRADNFVSTSEFNYMEKIQKSVGISDVQLNDSQHLNVIECLILIRDFSKENKENLVNIFYEIISSDEDINEKETKAFMVVCQSADIDIPIEISKKLRIK